MYRMKRKTIQMTKGVKKRHQTVKRYRNYTKVYMSTGKKTTIGNYFGGSKHELNSVTLNFNVLTNAFIAT